MARWRCVRGQAGFGLLESIVSIALTTIVVLGLTAGLITSVRSSASASAIQKADSALASFGESLRSMPVPDPPPTAGCPVLTKAAPSNPDGFIEAYDNYAEAWSASGVTTRITVIEHWDPAAGAYSTVCPGADPSVHRLSIEVTVDGTDSVGQVVVGEQ